ncbi:hypothetical protein Xish_02295 [Xenorhabdus ishibashii]|uniref:Uncharacterized protein n=1 Tax=Xenorhabdus ishibashii TaxID=1034471 RepID=A0A2D0KI11_9GAMM|nr:hypothetical protein Xish_02295 [Xenorhabdus ishibashii]
MIHLNTATIYGTAKKTNFEHGVRRELKLFLMSDAVAAGLAWQAPKESYNLKQMLEILMAQSVDVRLIKTCTDAREISELTLVDGAANDE